MNNKARNARRTDQEWINLIQECRTSGLGDKDWCEKHDIPISSFYTKITKLRRKACDIPAAQRHVSRQSQQVVPLPILDEVPEPYSEPFASDTLSTAPAVVLKIQSYSIEIANHAARETILNTLSALQQLC